MEMEVIRLPFNPAACINAFAIFESVSNRDHFLKTNADFSAGRRLLHVSGETKLVADRGSGKLMN